MNMPVANRFRRWRNLLGRLLIGALFIYAALSKFGSPQDFADRIAAYHVLPDAAINLLALGLPVFEFVCGILVLTGFYFRIGILGIVGMLAAFCAALTAALWHGGVTDCGCFGGHSWLEANPWISLLRDIFLFASAAAIYASSLPRPQAARARS